MLSNYIPGYSFTFGESNVGLLMEGGYHGMIPNDLVEDVSGDNQREAYVPYFVVSAPTTKYSFILQLQYRNREGSDVFVADLSAVF